jgi:RNA polymerase sigma factor (sigma-70 family)
MVNSSTLARARVGDEQAFRELTDPYRRELLLHCYQILGSVQDAEDMLQETLLAAWRGLPGFEGRASLRSWLHKIAANGCLNALRDRGRRPREVPLMAGPPEPTRQADPVWVEPYPDVLLDGLPDLAPGPEARYERASGRCSSGPSPTSPPPTWTAWSASSKRKLKKIQYRPHLITGCLAATGLTIESW